MELSSELIEIGPEKESNIWASTSAKAFAGCLLLIGIVALVLAVGLST